MSGDAEPLELMMLGRDHGGYGSCAFRGISPQGLCALTVGADRTSPSLRYKGDLTEPNEDALLLIEQGDRYLAAVADAHFGTHPSHDLIRALAAAVDGVPAEVAQLRALLAEVAAAPPSAWYSGASTLIIAVADAASGDGFGVSFGDSSCALVGDRGVSWPLNRHRHDFVSLADRGTLAPERGDWFDWCATPGELLLVFSDGIDGCHYGHPESSVGSAQLGELFAVCGSDPEAYCRGLMALALGGVDGHPGGQDNIALVVARGRR